MNISKLKTRCIAVTTATALLGFSSLGTAEDLDKERFAFLGGSVVTGGLVAGPPGAAVGFLVGALLGEKAQDEHDLESAEVNMASALNEIQTLEQEINGMEHQLAQMQDESNRLQENLLTRLKFQIMFRTGKDELTELDQKRVAILTDYLNRNQELHVRLDGHADLRGTDEYNNVLAKFRAKTVADALVQGGVAQDRIETYSHGASKARSTEGDYEGYALDRRVNIEVFDPRTGKDVANAN